MPTARELLEQADALMRRNRGGEGSIPVLTEHVVDALSGPSKPERAAERTSPPDEAEAANGADSAELTLALDRSLQDGVEPPMLTDVVEEVAVDLVPLPTAKAEEDWLAPDTVDPELDTIDPELNSITGPSPDSMAAVPPVTLRSASQPAGMPATELGDIAEERKPPESISATELTEVAEGPKPPATVSATEQAEVAEASTPPAAESTATPVPAESFASESATADDERWRALAEQVSMQVMQRLDLFVDSGLKAQLAAHLQPIVARAGTELVEAINEHVGRLVRSYVAEAIEREIAQWRQGQR